MGIGSGSQGTRRPPVHWVHTVRLVQSSWRDNCTTTPIYR